MTPKGIGIPEEPSDFSHNSARLCKKNSCNHLSHPTTHCHYRAIFGTVRVSSARLKAAIGKPLISIGFATCERGKFGGWFGAKRYKLPPTKRALQIFHLQAIENGVGCHKSPLL